MTKGCLSRREGAGTYDVRAPQELLDAVALEFDGTISAEDWVARHDPVWERSLLVRFVQDLEARGFLVNICDLPKTVWNFGANPRRIGSAPSKLDVHRITRRANHRIRQDPMRAAIEVSPQTTTLSELLKLRRTARAFSSRPVEAEALAALIWAGYGITGTLENDPTLVGRTVPSAGALHPLQLYLVNLRETHALDEGVYSADSATDTQPVSFQPNASARPNALHRAFGSPRLLENAQAIVVISGDFSRSAEKYGTRAMAYVAIEAGHVAQNIQLAATELKLATLQTGEFVEDVLACALGLPTNETPLIAMVVGYPGQKPAWPPAQWKFEWISYAGENAATPLYTARVMADQYEPWAWGSDRDSQRAALKAYMEAEERVRLTTPTALVKGAYSDLTNPIHPRAIIALSEEQACLPQFGLGSFDPEAQYAWKQGTRFHSDEPCFVLADLVYFDSAIRSHSSSPRYALANSSGVASYDTVEGATIRGTLELIERDAFMLAWMTFAPARLIDQHTLPKWAISRFNALTQFGLQVSLCDISTEFGIALMIFVQSLVRTFTRVATAAAFDPDQALEHALNEIESMAYASLATSGTGNAAPRFDSPAGHADYYNRVDTFRDADRIIEGDGDVYSYVEVGRNAPRSWSQVIDSISSTGFEMIKIDISDECPHLPQVKTIRSIIPGLIPLTFGACYTPLGMPRFIERSTHLSIEQINSLTRIPHPFV